MPRISLHIETKFYDVLNDRISVADFESWVYEATSVEQELPEEVYIDLISVNYKHPSVKNELESILRPYIHLGEFKQREMIAALKSIIQRDQNAGENILLTYHWYCKWYNFMHKLGLNYGLNLIYPTEWHKLGLEEKEKALDKFYPKIIADAQNVLSPLEDGSITLTNEELIDGPTGFYEYLDSRNEQEKSLTDS